MPRSKSTDRGLLLTAGILLFIFVCSANWAPLFQGRDEAKKTKAQLGCQQLATAIDFYIHSPSSQRSQLRTLNELDQPPSGGPSLLRNGPADLLDPWGNPYQMELKKFADGREYYLITTTAPDGTPISQFGIGPNAAPARE